MRNWSQESELLVDLIQDWQSVLQKSDYQTRICYASEVSRRYDALANAVAPEELVELRLLRSYWAKKLAQVLVQRVSSCTPKELEEICGLLAVLRTLLGRQAVRCLIDRQYQVGNESSRKALVMLLAEHAIHEEASVGLRELDAPHEMLLRLGPAPIAKFRPSRKTGSFDSAQWLSESAMSGLEFVDGNPDRIRVRGIELRSGDIGIVELNHPGDGLLESFLQQPGLAPHAMLYVTRRALDPRTNEVLFQPSVLEIFEGGWRSVPITTALHPNFTWYSEWVRPRIDGCALSDDVGAKLSDAIDSMEVFSFDFQARRIPTGGRFPVEFGGACASCTNLLRVPFERAGIHGLPYPTTALVPKASRNLAILGLPEMDRVHTPTNILNNSGFEKIGIVDNGLPEIAYAQAIVVGRPELPETFGGWMSQRSLQLENLPNWTSILNWKSAWEALRIRIGQSEGQVASAIRKLMDVDEDEVPKSASDTTIAFYLRSDIEAKNIIIKRVLPAVTTLLENAPQLTLLSQLRAVPEIVELVRRGIFDSALRRENWYSE